MLSAVQKNDMSLVKERPSRAQENFEKNHKIMIRGAFSIKGPIRAISSNGSWTVPTTFKFFKSISFIVQGSNLDHNGGFNKAMIRSTQAG